ncbi:hypothetical protein CERSUDRAFT_120170 [Gelatoporia subvermispora B]|uniref:CBF1-interacting co-repressor CIR N-terminal domain-containing protein n=1 Tax=Ceriporiopsis subvermispora (strain B) TaxID=914234 RepID=M2QG95_CERS8|nr:hypothetical protein CERSUDRAFT_120170 [Gelatoporia subvermispora B]
MGKLNIAHHKSYHPYRRDNIERVRRDEEEARLKESAEEGRMMLADSEARIDLLRQRAGTRSKPRRDAEEEMDVVDSGGRGEKQVEVGSAPASLMSGGHINLFEDLERFPTASRAPQKAAPAETEKGIPLAPSAKDLKPWYSDRRRGKGEKGDEERQLRDLARKSVNDPLTSINHQLSSRGGLARPVVSSSRSNKPSAPASSVSGPGPGSGMAPPPEVARRNRESAERQRAMELIKRKKRELEGSETPSTVRGGAAGMGGGYGDVYNRREVEEAHRHRERRDEGAGAGFWARR